MKLKYTHYFSKLSIFGANFINFLNRKWLKMRPKSGSKTAARFGFPTGSARFARYYPKGTGCNSKTPKGAFRHLSS